MVSFARIEQPPLFYIHPAGGLDGLPLRVSNEGLLKPCVAREHLNPFKVYENQNGFTCDRADDVLRLPICLRLRENLGILKAITKNLSNPVTEIAGTPIAVCLSRRLEARKQVLG
jgi:hypothetical protein